MSLDGVLAIVASALKHLSVANATSAVPDLLRYAMGERSAGLFSVFLLLESTERTNPELKSLWSAILKNCMAKAVDLRAGKKVTEDADEDEKSSKDVPGDGDSPAIPGDAESPGEREEEEEEQEPEESAGAEEVLDGEEGEEEQHKGEDRPADEEGLQGEIESTSDVE